MPLGLSGGWSVAVDTQLVFLPSLSYGGGGLSLTTLPISQDLFCLQPCPALAGTLLSFVQDIARGYLLPFA